MVVGMATRKVTVTLDEGQLERIRRSGEPRSFVECVRLRSARGGRRPRRRRRVGRHAGRRSPPRQWGELSREERSWADNLLGATSHTGSPARLVAGMTLDAGGLIALERNDRRLLVLLARAQETGARVTVPATALAQAIRQPEAAGPTFSIGPSTKYGRGCARPSGRHERRSAAGSQRKDSHRRCSRRDLRQTGARQPVVTSDADDLRALDPSITVVEV